MGQRVGGAVGSWSRLAEVIEIWGSNDPAAARVAIEEASRLSAEERAALGEQIPTVSSASN